MNIELQPGESFEYLMKRFRKYVDDSGILRELRKREYYIKPSEKRRKQKRKLRAKALQRQRDNL